MKAYSQDVREKVLRAVHCKRPLGKPWRPSRLPMLSAGFIIAAIFPLAEELNGLIFGKNALNIYKIGASYSGVQKEGQFHILSDSIFLNTAVAHGSTKVRNRSAKTFREHSGLRNDQKHTFTRGLYGN